MINSLISRGGHPHPQACRMSPRVPHFRTDRRVDRLPRARAWLKMWNFRGLECKELKRDHAGVGLKGCSLQPVTVSPCSGTLS
jgi:hypothetical protein